MTDPRTIILYAAFGALWTLSVIAPPSAAERIEGRSPEPGYSLEGNCND